MDADGVNQHRQTLHESAVQDRELHSSQRFVENLDRIDLLSAS